MKSVLMLAQWYPPCQAWPTAATRTRLLATNLPEQGWETTVLVPDLSAGACGCAWCKAPSTQPVDPSGTTVYRLKTRPSAVRAVSQQLRTRSTPPTEEPSNGSAPNRSALSELAWQLGDTHSNWARVVSTQADQLLRRGSFDALWTTSGPYAHLRIGARLARRHGIPWIADLRDPASTDVTAPEGLFGRLVRARRSVYRQPLLKANSITTAIQHVVEVDGPWLGREPILIPPGFDSNEWDRARVEASPPAGRFEIVYAGRFYEQHQRLDMFLQGLELAASRMTADDRKRLRFVYYGRNGPIVRNLAIQYGSADLVEDRGFVQPDSMPGVLASATLLLLLSIGSGGSRMPGGKLYEYLGARRPILAVPGGGRRVASTLSETRAGIAVDDAQAVANEIGRSFGEWQAHGQLAFGGLADRIGAFSARHSARSLADLLDSMTAELAGSSRVSPHQTLDMSVGRKASSTATMMSLRSLLPRQIGHLLSQRKGVKPREARERVLMVSAWWPPVSNPHQSLFIIDHSLAMLQAAGSLDAFAVSPGFRASLHADPVEPPGIRVQVRAPGVPWCLPRRLLVHMLSVAGQFAASRSDTRPRAVCLQCFDYAGPYAIGLARGLGCPLIYLEHWSAICLGELPPKQLAMLRFVLTKADATLAVSQFLASEMEVLGNLPRGTVRVVENSVDPSIFKAQPAPARRQGVVIAQVADFRPVKGHGLLVDALDGMGREEVERLGLRFVLVGDGPERQRIEQRLQAMTGIAERVRFTGRLSRREVARVIADADWTLLTSKVETASCVARESLAIGRPVLAPRVGALPALLADTDSVLFDRDVEGLLRALRTAAARTDDDFSWQARSEMASVRFAPSALAKTYGQILDELSPS